MPKDQRWVISYKKVPAPATQGIVEASSEIMAIKVAERWCMLNNARFIGGSVRSEVLANESILKVSIEAQPEPLPDPITATTDVG
jgi:hypothetical protein